MTPQHGEALPFRIKPILHRAALGDLLGRLSRGEFDSAALILEGRGGMGKTFFLNQLDTILGPAGAGPRRPGAPLRVGAIDAGDPQRVLPLDLIYADVALPRTFEQILLRCIERSGAPDHFAAYRAALGDYQRRRQHLSFADLIDREQQLRELFFAGWEALAGELQALLVVSFDTCEYLERTRISDLEKVAESRDLGQQRLGVREQFFSWIEAAVRRLPQTLFVFCGRGVVSGELFRRLYGATNGAVEVFDLEELELPAVDQYLGGLLPVAAGPRADQARLAHLICDGLPLKLDLLHQLLLSDRGWCEREIFGSQLPPSLIRERFYHEALRRFFDPASYLGVAGLSPAAQAHGLCLICLAYARCGASLDDLRAFVAHYGLEQPPEDDLRAYLEDHALVKKLSPRVEEPPDGPGHHLAARRPQYFIHDQLWVDVDAIFRDSGTGAVVWAFLARRRLAAIEACDIDELWRRRIELMCEHLVVAMLSDPVGSYQIYTSYVDQALRRRDVDGAVVLSETFWRTVYYETSNAHGRFFPVLSSLRGSRVITLEAIGRDERVRQLRVLAALSRPEHQAGPWPRQPAPDDDRERRALARAVAIAEELEPHCPADDYLRLTLRLGMVDVWLTYDPYHPRLRDYLIDSVAGLEAVMAGAAQPAAPDPTWRNARAPLLRLRGWLLLARAYRYRAELNENLRHFQDGALYAERSLAALDAHQAEDDGDPALRERALAEVCWANSLVRLGRRNEAAAALGRIQAMLLPADAPTHRLAAYDRVFVLARCAMAFPDDGASEPLSRQALELATTIGVKRALDIARLARLIVLRRQDTLRRLPPDDPEQRERSAQIDQIVGQIYHDGRLDIAADMRDETIHEIARMLRSRFAHRYGYNTSADMPLSLLQQAYRLIVESGVERELERSVAGPGAGQPAQWYRRVQYADLITTKVSLFSALLMTLHQRARDRGQRRLDQATILRHLPRIHRRTSAVEARPLARLEHLWAALDAVAQLLERELGEGRHHDPYILVALGKIAIQRGLLHLYAADGPERVGEATGQLALALAFAARFSAEPNPIFERDVFLALARRALRDSGQIADPAERAAAEAALAGPPPAPLRARPDLGSGDQPGPAWRTACELVRAILAEPL